MAISVTCPKCDRRLKAPPTVVGKKIRCPACEAVFLCQDDEEIPVEAAPKLKRERDEPEESSDDSEAGDDQPRRRRRRRPSVKKRSSAGLWIGLAVAGALVILLIIGGGAVLVSIALRRPSIPDGDWVTFATPDGACSVQMPGTPTFQMLPVNGLILNKYLLVRQREDVFFTVGYLELPTRGVTPELLKMSSAGERDNLIQKLGGSAIVDQDVTVLGYVGRDLQIRSAPPHRGIIMERIFLVPNGVTTRLYIVGTGGSTIEPGSGAAAKFFDSLAIKAAPAALSFVPINHPVTPPAQTVPTPNPSHPPGTPPPAPMTPQPRK